jgi:Cdc6-like AAA superfamily ATPase
MPHSEPRGGRNSPPPACPEQVPFVLWSSLQSLYNESQLRAMVSCIRHASSESGPSDVIGKESTVQSQFPLMLLQGPPGTGKTHTILGMISLLLAVGAPGDAQRKAGRKVGVAATDCKICTITPCFCVRW